MKKISVILILAGFVLVIIGLVINKSKDQKIPDYQPKVVEQGQTTHGDESNPEFINFVSNRFSARYFTVNKIEEDHLLALADLKVDYEIREIKGHFLLKTKWALRYQNNKIDVATPQEISDYSQYLQEFDEPLFKIIGIGGRPSKPKLIYIIPVAEIISTSLTINEISKYIKDDQAVNFFFDISEKSLK